MLRSRFTMLCAATCAAVGLIAISASPASAIGYYNLPGSFCQCFGYGNGAGYHSCLVLGPSTCWDCCVPNEVRLEHPPQPPYGCYGNGQCGSMSGGTWIDNRTQIQPPAPEPTPAPTAARPQVHRQPRIW